jgi:hypothetical protein
MAFDIESVEQLLQQIIARGGVKSSVVREGDFETEVSTHSLQELLSVHKYLKETQEKADSASKGCLYVATGKK